MTRTERGTETMLCQWFAMCDNSPAGTVHHPAFGNVPTCQRCADKLDLTFTHDDGEGDYMGDTRNGWGWTADAMEYRHEGTPVVSVPFLPNETAGGYVYVTNVGTAVWGPFDSQSDAVTASIDYLTREGI